MRTPIYSLAVQVRPLHRPAAVLADGLWVPCIMRGNQVISMSQQASFDNEEQARQHAIGWLANLQRKGQARP